MIDCTPQLRAIRDQGHRGTCVAFAVTAAHEHARTVRRGALADDLSVELLFWRSKQLDGLVGDGTTFGAARHALRDPGQCDEARWPYQSLPVPPAGSNPPAAALEVGNLKHATMTSIGVDTVTITGALAAPRTVVGGIRLWGGFYDCESATVAPPAGDVDPFALHAVCLAGIDQERGTILVRNSWGRRWGHGGYAWLELRALDEVLLEAWVVGDDIDSP